MVDSVQITITVESENPDSPISARELAERLHHLIDNDETGNWATTTVLAVNGEPVDGWATSAAEEDAYVAGVLSAAGTNAAPEFVASA